MASIIQRGWRYFRWVLAKPHPVRYLIACAMFRHNWFSWLRFRCGRYVLRLHGTWMSWDMWSNPRLGWRDRQLLDAYLRPGDTVIDVGANIGAITLHAASLIGPTGTVFSIEPNRKVFQYLLENCQANGFGNVRAFNLALGRGAGSVQLSEGNYDDRKFIVEQGRGPAVEMKRLDDLDIPQAPIALLKIDVEGYERFVLEGAAETLRRTACVYYESFDYHCSRFGYSSNLLIRLLESSGFKVLRWTHEGVLEEVAEDYSSANGNENLVAVRDVGGFMTRTGFSVVTNRPAK